MFTVFVVLKFAAQLINKISINCTCAMQFSHKIRNYFRINLAKPVFCKDAWLLRVEIQFLEEEQ